MENWEHLRIPFSEIKYGTKDFVKIIGRGGYGFVYEGELSFNGKYRKVAVKRFTEQSGKGIHEFMNEIQVLSSQQHENLITLVGYCHEQEEMIIVYEYAERGSLDRYIRSSRTSYTFTWVERLKIVVGVARGLDHLHNHAGVNQTIIHREIKSSNILLDDNWVPKISNLGLSVLRLPGLIERVVGFQLSGSVSYVEPEYVQTGFLTKKTDVYSFGMLLFEILCGRLSNIRDEAGIFLSGKVAKKYYNNGELEETLKIEMQHGATETSKLFSSMSCKEEIQEHLKKNLPIQRDEAGIFLSAEVAKEYYNNGELNTIIDPSVLEQMISPDSLSRYSEIAYKCLLRREERPLIDVVRKELEETLKIEMQHGATETSELLSSMSCKEVEIQEHLKKNLPIQRSKLSIRRFSQAEIYSAINEFAQEKPLGEGAFGKVYRGNIFGKEVAVKRMNMTMKPEQGILAFQKEIDLLSACNQVNIISLVGYCDEEDEKILVYEYMPNGSLFDYLFTRPSDAPQLTVEQRLEICLGVAKGLNYLHSGIDFNIIHSDIKTENILLDCNLVPKISDFGLSRTRDVGPSTSQVVTNNIQGTEGYIAPECYEPGYKLSRKADVYAFGVVLLEVLCERPPWKRLVLLALPIIMSGELHKLTPKHVKENISPGCIRECENIIWHCLENDTNKRLVMTEVVHRLEFALKLQKQYRSP